eukprot:TRINITY_DN57769_c0_g1_i1.p1 TRINITY_DN57769_c0_g1~~TRINITY_DN57769_c0_g1_i1.p1  ORF type:complete len:735 (+),score=71.75 TRINITY_DN57769_c0_g1_i1:112-2316(+)
MKTLVPPKDRPGWSLRVNNREMRKKEKAEYHRPQSIPAMTQIEEPAAPAKRVTPTTPTSGGPDYSVVCSPLKKYLGRTIPLAGCKSKATRKLEKAEEMRLTKYNPNTPITARTVGPPYEEPPRNNWDEKKLYRSDFPENTGVPAEIVAVGGAGGPVHIYQIGQELIQCMRDIPSTASEPQPSPVPVSPTAGKAAKKTYAGIHSKTSKKGQRGGSPSSSRSGGGENPQSFIYIVPQVGSANSGSLVTATPTKGEPPMIDYADPSAAADYSQIPEWISLKLPASPPGTPNKGKHPPGNHQHQPLAPSPAAVVPSQTPPPQPPAAASTRQTSDTPSPHPATPTMGQNISGFALANMALANGGPPSGKESPRPGRAGQRSRSKSPARSRTRSRSPSSGGFRERGKSPSRGFQTKLDSKNAELLASVRNMLVDQPPPGWRAIRGPDGRRCFLHDHSDRAEFQIPTDGQPMTRDELPQTLNNGEPIPKGWRVILSPHGLRCYIADNKGQAVWHFPKSAMKKDEPHSGFQQQLVPPLSLSGVREIPAGAAGASPTSQHSAARTQTSQQPVASGTASPPPLVGGGALSPTRSSEALYSSSLPLSPVAFSDRSLVDEVKIYFPLPHRSGDKKHFASSGRRNSNPLVASGTSSPPPPHHGRQPSPPPGGGPGGFRGRSQTPPPHAAGGAHAPHGMRSSARTPSPTSHRHPWRLGVSFTGQFAPGAPFDDRTEYRSEFATGPVYA